MIDVTPALLPLVQHLDFAVRGGLWIVVLPGPSAREEVIEALRADLGPSAAVQRFHYSERSLSLADRIRQLPRGPAHGVLLVSGLDDLENGSRRRAIDLLNRGREALAEMPWSVVLFVLPPTLPEIIHRAGDFWSFRRGVTDLGGALPAGPEELPPARRYLDLLVERYGTWSGFGAGDPARDARVPFEDLFVPVRWLRPVREERIRRSLSDALEEHGHILLLGEAGSGKTALLQYLMLTYARGEDAVRRRLRLMENRLPIRIELRSIPTESLSAGEGPMSFLDELFQQQGMAGFSGLCRRRVEEGTAILLFDGLDDVVDLSVRALVVGLIQDLAEEAPRNRILVSCRAGAHRLIPLGGGFATYLLPDLDDEALREHVLRFAEVVYAAEWQQRARADLTRFADTIVGDRRLRRLGTNHLLLQIMLMAYRAHGRVPTLRTTIYREAAQLLGPSRAWDSYPWLEEYSTARAVLRRGALLDELGRHLHDPRWTEPLRLAASMAVQDRSISPLSILRAVLDRKSPFEEILHRDRIMAARLMADVEAPHERIAREILTPLLDLLAGVEGAGRFALLLDQVVAALVEWAGTPIFEHCVVPALLDGIRHADARVRLRSVRALGAAQALDAGTARILADSLHDGDLAVRREAMSALTRLGPEARRSLVGCVSDPDEQLREMALLALGDVALDALPAVLGALADPCSSVRAAAVIALGDSSAPEALRPLQSALAGDESPAVRAAAAAALGRAEGRAEIEPALLAAAADEDARVRASVARALGKSRSERSRRRLAHLLDDGDSPVREAAAASLGEWQSSETIQSLSPRLLDDDEPVRDAAALALQRLWPAERDGLERAIEGLSSRRDPADLRVLAVGAAKIGIRAEWVRKALLDQLTSGRPPARARAAACLGELRGHRKSTTRMLMSAARGPHAEVRAASVLALVRAGEARAGVVSLLLSTLGDGDARVRAASLGALRLLGLKKLRHLGDVTRCLGDRSPMVRAEAARTLEHFGLRDSGGARRDLRATCAALGSALRRWTQTADPSADAMFEALSSLAEHAAIELGRRGDD